MFTGRFIFNGENSTAYNLYAVTMDTGVLQKSTLAGSGTIEERDMQYDHNPVFTKITRNPISFTLQMALVNDRLQPIKWTDLHRRRVAHWLTKKKYTSLEFEENPGRLYYVLAVGEIGMHTAPNGGGYVEVEFRTHSAYAMKPKRTEIIDATSQPISGYITCDQFLAEPVFPTIYLEQTGTPNGTLNFYKEGKEADTIRFTSIPSYSQHIVMHTKEGIIKDITNNQFLYNYKNPYSKNEWIQLNEGSNRLTLSRGWKARLEFQESIF